MTKFDYRQVACCANCTQPTAFGSAMRCRHPKTSQDFVHGDFVCDRYQPFARSKEPAAASGQGRDV